MRLSFDIRPVLEHVKALAPLMLWRDEPLHAEAIFHVEPRRCVRTNMFVNTYNTSIRTDHEGNEVGEAHERGYFNVRDTEIAEFTAFCARVWDMVDAVAPEDAQTTDVKGRKRRFRRAMDHLVLATAGTHGPGHVDPHEADELLLRCVIGLEAILTGGQQMNSRPMKNNGKALWLGAAAQNTTEATFDKVYGLRCKYAHGDDVVGLDETAVLEARTLLRDTILRWLVTSHALGSDIVPRLPTTMTPGPDRTTFVETPLRNFFNATPPARRPSDA